MWSVTPVFMACLVSPILATYNRTHCPRCAHERSLLKQMTKESIKKEMLRKLGFTEPPNISARHLMNSSRIREMIREVESDAGMQGDEAMGGHFSYDHEDVFRPEKVRIFATEAPTLIPREVPIFFNLGNQVINSRNDMSNAILNVHLPAASDRSNTLAKVQIFYIKVDKTTHKASISNYKEAEVELRVDSGGWVRVHVLHLARIWMEYPHENHGIVVKAKNEAETEELEIGDMDTEHAPYLEIDIEDTGYIRSRIRRTANNVCSEEHDNSMTDCCMWPLKIDFAEFGWEFILYPHSYEAKYCSGSCDLGMPAENAHGSVTQMLPNTVGLCCAPKKLKPIAMLYLDQQKNVMKGMVPNMKVVRCGCI